MRCSVAVLQLCMVITLLADRGFLHERLIQHESLHQWHFRLRISGSTMVHRTPRDACAVKSSCPPVGHMRFFHRVALLGAAVGLVHLDLACPIDHPHDPWFVASHKPNDAQTLDEYSLRFDIEEAFLDEKSAGFQTSELSTPKALERLLLVVAMATLHLTSIGLGVFQAGTRSFRGYQLGPWFELSEDRLAMAAARASKLMAGVCSFLV